MSLSNSVRILGQGGESMGVSKVISLQEVPAKLGREPPNYHALLFFFFLFTSPSSSKGCVKGRVPQPRIPLQLPSGLKI